MAIRYDAGEVITAMITPFDNNLQIDFSTTEKLATYLANNGSDGILVAGTTGESPTLTHEEELELLAVVKKAVNGKSKVIIGAGSNSTETAVKQTKEVSKAGADAVLSVVPYYNKPSQAGLKEHFGQIAKATELPIILYNIPGRTGINMMPETIAWLAKEYSNIVAVKQSFGDLDLVTEIISAAPEDFVVYSGDDSLTLPMLSLGAHGIISVASHLIGNEIKEMITKFKAGDVCCAKKLHHACYPIFKKIFMCPNPTPVKAALQKCGMINDSVRPPLVTLTEDEKQELFAVLDNYKNSCR